LSYCRSPNLSNDPEQQYFADGITENVTTDLSRIAHSFVISRNTAFTYRSKPVETKQIGRELGVRYVLEGSVQRSGNWVRINAQLIDAETDKHLWTDRFDRDLGDLFALQNEITGRIANTLNFELVGMEAARPTDHPEALDYIFRGRAANNKGSSREAYAEAIDQYERALDLDPGSVEARGLLAGALGSRVLDKLTDTAAADLERAKGTDRTSLGDITARLARASRQGRTAARAVATRRSHARIRDGARSQSQLNPSVTPVRLVQMADRVDR
jgi:adenylate cyclase